MTRWMKSFRRRKRRYVSETQWPDTYQFDVPGHNGFYDGLDGYGSENTLTCECGQEMYPNCDMSSVSISACFNTHRLNAMSGRTYKDFIRRVLVEEPWRHND